MAEYRFMPRRGMSQNFIINEWLIDKMVEYAALEKSDRVLEIGSGTGFLTRKLLEHCSVIGFEKDEKMAKILADKLGSSKNFTLQHEDFLSAKIPKFNKVVSLPPYNISSDLIIKLFTTAPQKVVLVLQREFVEKVTALPGFMDYNYISVLTALRFEPEVVMSNVSPRSFYPAPESFSSMVVLNAKKDSPQIKDTKMFVFFLKNLFRYKNKSLSNAMKNSLPSIATKMKVDAKKADKTIQSSGLESEKLSTIEPEIFAELFNRIS